MAQTHLSNIETVDKTNKDTIDEVVVNSEVQNETESSSIAEKLRRFLMFFTVEPMLLCYILPSVISSVTIQKLNLEKACRTELNYTKEVCASIIAGHDNETIGEVSNHAYIMVANMIAWKQPILSSVPAIVILFVGAWSDRTGNRKALMLVPIIGDIVSTLGLIVTTYFFEMPLWLNGLIEAIPQTFTGGLSIALMGAYSFIADLTTLDSRTFRIGLLAVIVTAGVPLGSAISGILTETVGYYGIFGLDLFLYGFGFIYGFFRLEDVKKEPLEGSCFSKVIDFFHPKNAWDTLSLVFLSRGQQLIQIFLVIWAHIVIIGPVFGEGGVLYLYLLEKYHMNIIGYSLFSTYSVVMGVIGTAVAVTLFSQRMKMHDAILGVISTTSKIAGSLMYAFAPNKSILYTAPLLDFFGNTGSTVIRSLGTKVVPPENVGKMCSLIGFIEAILPVVYGPIYSKVFSETLDSFPGTFYVLGAVMTTPAVFIFIYLYLRDKQERDRVKNPEDKEMYAHDNAVTVL